MNMPSQPTKEEQIQRYRCYYLSDFGDSYDAMGEHDPDGDWVRYDDHMHVSAQRDQWQERAERICNLVLRLNSAEGLSASALAGLQRMANAALGKQS